MPGNGESILPVEGEGVGVVPTGTPEEGRVGELRETTVEPGHESIPHIIGVDPEVERLVIGVYRDREIGGARISGHIDISGRVESKARGFLEPRSSDEGRGEKLAQARVELCDEDIILAIPARIESTRGYRKIIGQAPGGRGPGHKDAPRSGDGDVGPPIT